MIHLYIQSRADLKYGIAHFCRNMQLRKPGTDPVCKKCSPRQRAAGNIKPDIGLQNPVSPVLINKRPLPGNDFQNPLIRQCGKSVLHGQQGNIQPSGKFQRTGQFTLAIRRPAFQQGQNIIPYLNIFIFRHFLFSGLSDLVTL